MSSPSKISRSVAHSAVVRMYLVISSQRIGVAQVGPDFMILDEPMELPAGRGELVVEVDGNERRRVVNLPDGLRASEMRTQIAPA